MISVGADHREWFAGLSWDEAEMIISEQPTGAFRQLPASKHVNKL